MFQQDKMHENNKKTQAKKLNQLIICSLDHFCIPSHDKSNRFGIFPLNGMIPFIFKPNKHTL